MFSKIWQKKADTIPTYPCFNDEFINTPKVEIEPVETSLLRKLIHAELSNMVDVQNPAIESSFQTDVEGLVGIKHYTYLMESIKNAKEQLVIMSGWLSKYVIDAAFLELISNKLEQGVSLYIGYGFQDSKGKHKQFEGSKEVQNSLIDLIKKHPNQLFVANYATHEKLLVVDKKIAVIGSANWLSNRQYTNSERSAIITDRKYVTSAADKAISAVMQNRMVVKIPKPKHRANESELSPADRDLFFKLKAVRINLAREQSVPAYFIFSDAVLINIARKRPITPKQMLAISGVGKVKLERYGVDFMQVVSAA